MDVSIENVINISVSLAGQGAGEYNTSNLAIFTHEEYNSSTFGAAGYKIYLEPSDVGTDFGTDSDTYKQALQVFSQQPNILANSGYLVVIPVLVERQTISFDTVPDEGAFVVSYDGGDSDSIAFDDTFEAVQAAIRAIAGLEKVIVTGTYSAGFEIQFFGVEGDIVDVTTGTNTLKTSSVAVNITVAELLAGEVLKDAIVRSEPLVQYFGLMATYLILEAELLEVGAVIQASNKIGFFGSRTAADIDPDGSFDKVRQASLYKTRCLFYGGTTDVEVMGFVAAYAGRGLSTNFAGDNTTQTMHLKDLSGVLPDPSMTQTLLNKAEIAGADVYVSIQGVPKTFTSGTNRFFDDVYNLEWFIGALQIAGFNVLAQTGTKIAQTEDGIDSIKSAYRKICEQANANQFLAGGTWTSPNTFGVQADFYDNISQRGYYMYSKPIGLQSPTDRADRKAPLIQIAAKYAGAVHSSSVIISVNQ